jgi:hypothetical protein
MRSRYLAASLLLAVIGFGIRANAGKEEAFPDGLSGRDVYERVVANRFRSFAQKSTLLSADRTGRQQESRFHMKWPDFRPLDGTQLPDASILSKTLVRYSHPFDLRHAGYLIQTNRDRVSDQFVYYPSKRRVVRVSLRNEAVYGTDFSFEDVVPREAGDFEYQRQADAEIDGVPVYVVELFPVEFTRSEYSRIRVFVDQKRAVVVRARYWDNAGVEIKELRASPNQIREFAGIFVPMQATMRNLLLDSSTTLVVNAIEVNPEFNNDTWNLRRLEGH